jgi:hypothetical protein
MRRRPVTFVLQGMQVALGGGDVGVAEAFLDGQVSAARE